MLMRRGALVKKMYNGNGFMSERPSTGRSYFMYSIRIYKYVYILLSNSNKKLNCFSAGERTYLPSFIVLSLWGRPYLYLPAAEESFRLYFYLTNIGTVERPDQTSAIKIDLELGACVFPARGCPLLYCVRELRRERARRDGNNASSRGKGDARAMQHETKVINEDRSEVVYE